MINKFKEEDIKIIKKIEDEARIKNIQWGYCFCGCGNKTKISNYTIRKYFIFNGLPLRYINGHNSRFSKVEKVDCKSNKYIYIYCPHHPRTNNRKYVLEHILIAEKALGKFLPNKAEIHHWDKNGKNNKTSNLLICQDSAYHHLIHRRMNSYKVCKHANWRKCTYCKVYDRPENLKIVNVISKNGNMTSRTYHKSCASSYERKRRQKV